MKQEGLKIVVIGGGSSYTPEIAEGLIRRKDKMKVRELVLLDIESGKEKVTVIEGIIGRMFRSASMETNLRSSTDPEEAFMDCDYIICQIRAGGLRSRELDERIPLKYGLIGQETTGVGGLFNCLRSIPQVVSLAKLAEMICPDAWFINFANPAGMVTEAILKETRAKAVGLCNVPINMAKDIADQLRVKREEIYVRYFGLNHLSWVTGVRYRSKEVLPELMDNRESRQLLSNVPLIQGAEAFIKKLGVIPSPYLNYYYFENEMYREELESSKTEGTRAEVVMKLEEELFQSYRDTNLSDKPVQLEKRGGSLYSEAAISLIESLYNEIGGLHVLNVLNRGAHPGLPEDCVVEATCLVGRNGISPLSDGALPEHALSLVRQIKTYEQCAIRAALSGNRSDLFEAILSHPLIRRGENLEGLMEEMLNAHKAYLPQFFQGGKII